HQSANQRLGDSSGTAEVESGHLVRRARCPVLGRAGLRLRTLDPVRQLPPDVVGGRSHSGVDGGSRPDPRGARRSPVPAVPLSVRLEAVAARRTSAADGHDGAWPDDALLAGPGVELLQSFVYLEY